MCWHTPLATRQLNSVRASHDKPACRRAAGPGLPEPFPSRRPRHGGGRHASPHGSACTRGDTPQGSEIDVLVVEERRLARTRVAEVAVPPGRCRGLALPEHAARGQAFFRSPSQSRSWPRLQRCHGLYQERARPVVFRQERAREPAKYYFLMHGVVPHASTRLARGPVLRDRILSCRSAPSLRSPDEMKPEDRTRLLLLLNPTLTKRHPH